MIDLEPIKQRLAAATPGPRNGDMAALIEEVERLRMALDTVGGTIYTQGRGTKIEQNLLSFIRKELGRV